PKLVNWVEDNIEETLSFYRLPLAHHKHMKSTNMLERLNQEIKRRTLVVRIFPNPRSCLRLVRALAVEIHEKLHLRLAFRIRPTSQPPSSKYMVSRQQRSGKPLLCV